MTRGPKSRSRADPWRTATTNEGPGGLNRPRKHLHGRSAQEHLQKEALKAERRQLSALCFHSCMSGLSGYGGRTRLGHRRPRGRRAVSGDSGLPPSSRAEGRAASISPAASGLPSLPWQRARPQVPGPPAHLGGGPGPRAGGAAAAPTPT